MARFIRCLLLNCPPWRMRSTGSRATQRRKSRGARKAKKQHVQNIIEQVEKRPKIYEDVFHRSRRSHTRCGMAADDDAGLGKADRKDRTGFSLTGDQSRLTTLLGFDIMQAS